MPLVAGTRLGPPPRGRIARFGVFDLDPRTGELHKRGVRVHLQEQPFQILTLLLERGGDLVTRDELRQRLWSEDVFVAFEQGLNNAVAKIRTALGDSAESPRFVETLERRGYRFIATVEWTSTEPGAKPAAPMVHLAVGDQTMAVRDGSHVIGRDPTADLWVSSTLVSRQHARLVVRGGQVTIEDLGSRNGTFVNGVRLTAPVTLANGDDVRLGAVPMVVHIPSGQTRTVPLDPPE
jgi:DNA-binding winged helix-turn-helix (wHTH) protein